MNDGETVTAEQVARLIRRVQNALTEAEEQRRTNEALQGYAHRVLTYALVGLSISVVADIAEPLVMAWLLTR